MRTIKFKTGFWYYTSIAAGVIGYINIITTLPIALLYIYLIMTLSH